MSYVIETFVAGVLRANSMRQLTENFSVLSQHTHFSGADGDGDNTLNVSGLSYGEMFYPRFPESNTGFTFVVSTSAHLNTYANSNNQNDEVTYLVGLFAGTYRFTLLYHPANDQGIMDVQLDGVSVGTIDLYNASGSFNTQASIDGIVIATGAWMTLKLKMSTKHASSSGYKSRWSLAMFRRTSA